MGNEYAMWTRLNPYEQWPEVVKLKVQFVIFALQFNPFIVAIWRIS